MMSLSYQRMRMAIMPWVTHTLLPPLINCGLIAVGSLVIIAALNGIMVPHRIFGGGLTGITLLLKYHMPYLDIGFTYLLLNIPLALLGWFTISHRFIGYTLFGLGFFSLAASVVHVPIPKITDPLLAALCAGVITGIGGGLILRSLGSVGGTDILTIFLNKRFGFRLGTISFAINSAIIIAGAYVMGIQAALYSLIYLFACGRTIDMVISGFSIRKSVVVISSRPETLAQLIMSRIGRGVTFLRGEGAYLNRGTKVILTITTPTELPRLKELVLDHDPDAFVIINDTVEVLGRGHGVPKKY